MSARHPGDGGVKPYAAWRELSLTAAALLAATVLVMWAQAPTADCVMPVEAARRLMLDRVVDREHLERDLASAERVARRHAAASSGAGALPIRPDACAESLFQAIAARHGLATELVRANARERATQT